MKNSNSIFYAVVAGLFLIYVVGEATGLLFVAMLIILPGWVWLLNKFSGNG